MGFPGPVAILGLGGPGRGEGMWRWATLSREQQSMNVETVPGTFGERLADAQERDLAGRWTSASSGGPPRSWD